MALTILDIEAHLQEEQLPDAKRAELLFFRDAALRLISTHRGPAARGAAARRRR